MKRDEALRVLSQHKADIARRYRITSLGVFGSTARDEAQPDSDVDIVFETDAPNLFRTASMRQDLEVMLSCPVDVARLRPHMNPGLRQRILRDAVYV